MSAHPLDPRLSQIAVDIVRRRHADVPALGTSLEKRRKPSYQPHNRLPGTLLEKGARPLSLCRPIPLQLDARDPISVPYAAGRLARPSGIGEFILTPADNEQSTPAEGSEDFDAIVEQHSDFVYNVAYRVMGNTQEAEDVAQDAFLSAYRAYDRFRGQSHVTTWLYRITMNAALMRLRKTKKDRTLTNTGVDDMEVVDWTKNPHKDALDSELGDKLREGIDLLEPDLRAALVLRDVQGLSNAEAADALEITVSALKSRLHRARMIVRRYLEDYIKTPRA